MFFDKMNCKLKIILVFCVPQTTVIACLIVRECANICYGLTLVELKNVTKTARFDFENLKSKFNITFQVLIKVRFKDWLDKDYSEIK